MSPSPSIVVPTVPREHWLFLGLLALVWWPALQRCSIVWSLEPQYYYGWAVPFLAAYLLYERPLPPAEPRAGWRGLFVVMVACAAPQLFLRWLGEANSTSRLISWAMALSALGISLAALQLAGGPAWRRRWQASVLFLLVAVPWPIQIEQPVIQGLMRVNAMVATEVVNMSGIPAEARGNLIEIPTGVVGVNEACSGIRSLQSTFMAALFLALLYQISVTGSLLLVASGVGIAFVLNVVRTVFLTWQGATNGIEATEKWHDSAGFAILAVVLVALWLISQFLERRARQVASLQSA